MAKRSEHGSRDCDTTRGRCLCRRRLRLPRWVRLAAALLTALPAGLLRADPAPALPFAPGETLTYRIRWGLIIAGHASLRVLPEEDYNGEPALRFAMRAATTPFIDRLYRVRDRVESVVAADLSRALEYTQSQQEGRHARELEVYFDWDDTPQAWRVLDGEAREPVSIEPATFDPLSGVYALRRHPLWVGAEVEMPITDGKVFAMARGKVLREETISTPAGRYDTWVVQPELDQVRAVFEKSPDATVQVWLTRDERRLPVRVSSKVFIGHFTAELTSVTP
jgi:hypothetical protein